MKNTVKIPLFFFAIIYATQGLSDLPGQCLYYLQREVWHLTAFKMGLIAFITGLAWCIKPVFGILTDHFPIRGYKTRYYLQLNCLILICSSLYIVLYGLNFWSLIITGLCINIALAFSDVCNDNRMVVLEQSQKLNGRIQSWQWTFLGLSGLFVALFGAWIADKIPEPYNYKLSFLIFLCLPIITFIYLIKFYKETKTKSISLNINKFKQSFSIFKNKNFILCLLFIACFNFSPSFGTALMIKLREELGVDKMFLGWIGATGTVLGLTGYALYYWKAYKLPIRKMLYFAILFSALTNLFYLYIPNKWTVLLYTILFGTCSGIAFLVLLAFFAKIVPVGNEGFYYAFITSINNLFGRLGSVTGGYLFDHYGYNITVVVATLTTLLCILFIPHLDLELKKKNS